MLSCSTFVSIGPLAQSVERGTNNGKVVCSRLIPSRFHFLFGLLSISKYLRKFTAYRMLICCTFISSDKLCVRGWHS